MEEASNENPPKPETTASASDLLDDTVALNHVEDTEMKHDVAGKGTNRGILELIASAGKYWQEWEKLKGVLSFELKQVLSEYPEAKVTDEEQIGFLGETFAELMKRLDEALDSFDQGPPFTLQRLCEILIDARGIYPKLSKLALALEKNLLVTSMLTVSSDPYPPSTTEPNEAEKESEEQPDSAANGVENATCDGDDEVMTEVEEEAVIVGNATMDVEEPSETNPEPTST